MQDSSGQHHKHPAIKIRYKYIFFCFSLKLECEKLASEKIEIQRHYVMVSKINVFFFIITFKYSIVLFEI